MNQFPKGHIPWNKGLKGIHLSPQSQFTPKDRGDRHCCWTGGVQVNKNDCVYVQNPDKAYDRRRRPVVIYEETYGPVPAGFVVVHKDQDRYNDAPDNLEAISRAENLRRNLNRKGEQ